MSVTVEILVWALSSGLLGTRVSATRLNSCNQFTQKRMNEEIRALG